MFAKISGYQYWSKIDLCKGYWQIPLSMETKHRTAFQTTRGVFQLQAIPVGMVNSGAGFSRMMRKVSILYIWLANSKFVKTMFSFAANKERYNIFLCAPSLLKYNKNMLSILCGKSTRTRRLRIKLT